LGRDFYRLYRAEESDDFIFEKAKQLLNCKYNQENINKISKYTPDGGIYKMLSPRYSETPFAHENNDLKKELVKKFSHKIVKQVERKSFGNDKDADGTKGYVTYTIGIDPRDVSITVGGNEYE